MIKKLILLVAITFSLYANETDAIKTKFKAMAGTIITIVQNKNFTSEVRNNIIVETITPMFDFQLMAKLSLGKKWKSMDKSKQKEFIELYVQRMKKSYSAKIDKYTDEEILINSIKQPKKTRVILNTSLVSAGDRLEVVYKFYKPKKPVLNKNTWLVYDVVISGVSIIKTDKAQFSAVLRESNIDTLMGKLRK